MCTYVKRKVIRLPLDGIMKKLGITNKFDYANHLEKRFGNELWCGGDGTFDVTITEYGATYLDYIVEEKWDVEGEWGFAWQMAEEDIKKYKPLFDKSGLEYNPADLRKVAYCYYTGYMSPDYYEPEKITFENI